MYAEAVSNATTKIDLAGLAASGGLSPRRLKTLCQELDIHNLKQLHRALLDGRVRALPRFGAATEAMLHKVLEGRVPPARLKLALARSHVDLLLAWLRGAAGVESVAVAGSYRRSQETISNIDILVTARRGEPVVRRLTSYEEVDKVIAADSKSATVSLGLGPEVHLRIVPARSYGAALRYFTGSKAHNLAIRRVGQQRRLEINERGVFRGSRRIAGKSEKDVYGALGLPFIPPELREDRGEIEAAAAGRLPRLIALADLRGDLHAHTKATDGHDTITALAHAAREEGHEYLAVTDRWSRLAIVHGRDTKRLFKQMHEIDRFNETRPGIVLLKGIEVDILEDGELDFPNRELGQLDLVIAAVNNGFNLSRKKQTERILRAMAHPHFTILAHPTGRLIGKREPCDVDMPRIIHAAKERGCFLELNAQPDRLDMSDQHCRLAKEQGVLVSIAADAHCVRELSNLRFGIGQARRGWLEKNDVLNSRSLAALRPLLARTMQ